MLSIKCNYTNLFVVLLVLAVPLSSWAIYPSEAGSTQGPNLPAQLIVKFKPGAGPDSKQAMRGTFSAGMAAMEALDKQFGVRQKRTLLADNALRPADNPLKDVYLLRVDRGVDLEEMARQYENLPYVEYAEPDYVVELFEIPTDSLYPAQWPLHNTGQPYPAVDRYEGDYNDTLVWINGAVDADIDAQEVYANPPDNTGITVVGIIDTGVDRDHPDLAGRLWTNPGEIPDNGLDDDHNGYVDDINGWDFCGNPDGLPIWGDNDPEDYHGHGTHCAGIVAATSGNEIGIAGVCQNARIMCLKIFPIAAYSVCAEAIVYAADNGADVINMSWGGYLPSDMLEDAISYARRKNVIPIAAVGNSGDRWVSYPACYFNTMAIGTTQSDDLVTAFSTYHDRVLVVAPGHDILSLRASGTDMYASAHEPFVHIVDSLYFIASGTSMSCPHAVGVSAWIRSVSPGLIVDSVQEILIRSSDDIIDPYGEGDSLVGFDPYSGHGRVNLLQAIEETPARRAQISSPHNGAFVSGVVDIYGTADGDDLGEWVLEYGLGQTPASWTESYRSSLPITDAYLTSIDATALNGWLTVRLTVDETNVCEQRLFILNEDLVEITSPLPGDSVTACVSIVGTFMHSEFGYIVIEYGSGLAPPTWTLIDTVTTPVYDDTLVVWYPRGLVGDEHTIRVTLYDRNSGVVASDETSIVWLTVFSGSTGWTLHLEDTLISVQPNYGDFDDDGSMEIVLGTSQGVKFYDPADGSEKTLELPASASGDFGNAGLIAVGNLDGDGTDDFVLLGADGLYGYYSDGTELYYPTSRQPTYHTNLALTFRLFLKDTDGDGVDEILWREADNVLAVLRADGTGYREIASKSSFPADLDGDGVDEYYRSQGWWAEYTVVDNEIVLNTESGMCRVVAMDSLGNVVDSVDVDTSWYDGVNSSYYKGARTAADIDGDGQLEVIFLTHRGNCMEGSIRYMLFAYDAGLRPVPGWPRPVGRRCWYPSYAPLFGDLDGDGQLDYVVISWLEIYAYSMDGSPLGLDSTGLLAQNPEPGTPTQGLFVDIDADGRPEIVRHVEDDFLEDIAAERIFSFDDNGEVIRDRSFIMEDSAWRGNYRNNSPIVGDLNQDGFVDLLYRSTHGSLYFTNFDGVTIDDSQIPVGFPHLSRRMNDVAEITVKGRVAPPPAPIVRVESGMGTVKLTWNGLYSETAWDPLLDLEDFEGYRVWVSPEGPDQLVLLHAYDRENYVKHTQQEYPYEAELTPERRLRFDVIDEPFSLEELRCLYGSGPDPCQDASFDPLAFTADNPLILTSFEDSVIYFETFGDNTSDLSGGHPIRKVYPEEPYPSSLIPSQAQPEELTEDGYLKYFEYECVIEDVVPCEAYLVAVTAFDYGSPRLGVYSQENSPENQIQAVIVTDSTCSNLYCCQGMTGNVDFDPDDIADIADLTKIINYLFISFETIPCPEEANCDGDPEGIIDIGDLTALIDYLFITFEPLPQCAE
ncbi:MAG: S8 family serine peptidase [Candidatus Zixiibacteriota bacterium]|nr:MAG: S8 family serine peptidase [candidate division Zixibacteria bacterium]